jgi:hypothetical protein
VPSESDPGWPVDAYTSGDVFFLLDLVKMLYSMTLPLGPGLVSIGLVATLLPYVASLRRSVAMGTEPWSWLMTLPGVVMPFGWTNMFKSR